MTEPDFVSVAQLIRDPRPYHRRRVRAVGYCTLRFEGKAVYASAKDRDLGRRENALWLQVPIDEAALKLDGKTVLVEAEFNMEETGHLELYAGGFVDVNLLEEWSGDLKTEARGR
jgi:hypothetical protein